MSPCQTKCNGLSFTAYRGDGSVLLAFDLDGEKTHNLAGFAINAKYGTHEGIHRNYSDHETREQGGAQ